MSEKIIGIDICAPDAPTALAHIRKAEEMGIQGVWLTGSGGGTGNDSLMVLSAAATQTERIRLGTSIILTWPRHPVMAAHQAQVVAGLAPGRFRVGVGTGDKHRIEQTFGIRHRAPLSHLREYIRILKGLLQRGVIDMDGQYYTAHARLPNPIDVPVMASALRSSSFELCGAESDGAISWATPHQFTREVSLPALRGGAAKAGRPTPPLIVHAPVCVHEDIHAVRDGVRERPGYFPRIPLYSLMLAEAGFSGSTETGWTEKMLEAVVISGDEAAVAEQLQGIFAWGATEILATVIAVGDAGGRSEERTMRLLAEVSAA